MKFNNLLLRAFSVAAVLLATTACVDDITKDIDITEGVSKLIPYTVTAHSEVDSKAGIDTENHFIFETGDKLVISTDDGTLTGELILVEFTDIDQYSARFSGTLTYTGSGSAPSEDLVLKATLISTTDQTHTGVTSGLTTTLKTAVRQFSSFTATSKYKDKDFGLSQGTAFIEFNLSISPSPGEGTYQAVLYNDGQPVATADDIPVTAAGTTKFYAALPGGTELYHAKVSLCDIDFKFGGSGRTTLEGAEKYIVTKSSDDHNIPLTLESDANDCTVTLNIPADFQASSEFTGVQYSIFDGSSWASWLTVEETTTITLQRGHKVQFKGDNDQYYLGEDDDDDVDLEDNPPVSIQCDKTCFVYGNVMSLVNSTSFASATTLPKAFTFAGLFSAWEKYYDGKDWCIRPITNPIENHAEHKLVLPATQLSVGCYSYMFSGCNLGQAPALPATIVKDYCYLHMFEGCSRLVAIPELPASVLLSGCYEAMFTNCTSLTSARDLIVHTVDDASCHSMFSGCTQLSKAPDIQVTTLPALSEDAEYCFSRMFEGCTSLTTPPSIQLPTTSQLPYSCFSEMFNDCTNLATAPELPYTQLSEKCYYGMFSGCTSLTSAPVLPAGVLVEHCYDNMFLGCSSLNFIDCNATDISAPGCTSQWVEGVASSGTFYHNASMEDWEIDSVDGIPEGWTVVPPFDPDLSSPLTLEAKVRECTITIDIPIDFPSASPSFSGIKYSIDNGSTWSDPVTTTTDITLDNPGDKVLLKGDNDQYATGMDLEDDPHVTIYSDKACYAYGNVMSLVNSESFKTETALQSDLTFLALFCKHDENIHVQPNGISSHPTRKLVLPATRLSIACYGAMFAGCVIERAPELPATELSPYCYTMMFNLTLLKTAPLLPATVLTEGCYMNMFEGCRVLTSASDLNIESIDLSSCECMFLDCDRLVDAPDITVSTLSRDAEYCFAEMFQNCSFLVDPPRLQLPDTDLPQYCCYRMFKGCGLLATAPALPYTKLSEYCYQEMFSGCESLEEAPALPATDLERGCYSSMFNGCSSLNAINCQAVFTTDEGYTTSWVSGVSLNGTFTRNPAMDNWDINSVSGIPEGWTIVPPMGDPDLSAPLTFQAGENGAIITFTPAIEGISLSYCLDGDFDNTVEYTEPIVLSKDHTASFFGTSTSGAYCQEYDFYDETTASHFSCSDDCYVYGNIMSLLHPSDFETNWELPAPSTFAGLFLENEHLVLHTQRKLKLPATTLQPGCYMAMFRGCKKLTSAPELPATIMEDACYMWMFWDCEGLLNAPALPAERLAMGCYYGLFGRCVALTSAPELPATSLRNYCYGGMFNDCKALTASPILPATRLATGCYSSMFMGCTNLSTVTCLAQSGIDSDNLNSWLDGVSATGTFIKAASMNDWPRGASGIPTGWTIEDAGI